MSVMKKAALIVIVGLAVAGCSRKEEIVVQKTDPMPADTQVFPASVYSSAQVFPVVMADGTKCVVATKSSYGVAISCNWSK
jgi:hypothetical protein